MSIIRPQPFIQPKQPNQKFIRLITNITLTIADTLIRFFTFLSIFIALIFITYTYNHTYLAAYIGLDMYSKTDMLLVLVTYFVMILMMKRISAINENSQIAVGLDKAIDQSLFGTMLIVSIFLICHFNGLSLIFTTEQLCLFSIWLLISQACRIIGCGSLAIFKCLTYFGQTIYYFLFLLGTSAFFGIQILIYLKLNEITYDYIL